VPDEKDLSYMRWEVDYQDDLDFVVEIYKRLYQPDRVFLMEDVLSLLRKNPELTEINSAHTDHITDKSYLEALKAREGGLG